MKTTQSTLSGRASVLASLGKDLWGGSRGRSLYQCIMLVLMFVATLARAATNDLSGLLQKGLFEEEANRNLDAACAAYETLVKQLDKDRQIGATAIFRLGEVYRKQGKTNEAAAQYERIVRDFTEQTTLVTLSRQNLTGLGAARASAETVEQKNSSSPASDSELLSLVKSLSQYELRQVLPTLVPDQLLIKLLEQQQTEETKFATLNTQFGANHPEVIMAKKTLQKLDEQILTRMNGIVKALELRAAATSSISPPENRGSGSPTVVTSIVDEEEAEIRRIQAMIQNSPDLINGSPNMESPLITAARAGQLRIVKFLLDKRAKIDVAFGNKTALHNAAQSGHRAMVELLLEWGADVNARDGTGGTALHGAAQDGFLSIVELLLKYKADPGIRNSKSNGEKLPLHLAARAGHVATVRLLAANGSNVDTKDAGGNSPLLEAAAKGHRDTVAALMEAKANIGIANNYGRTPLHAAAESGHTELVTLFLESKAEVDTRDQQRATPLVLAVYKQDAAIVEILLNHKANPDLPGAVDKSLGRLNHSASCRPIEHAIDSGNTEILAKLLKQGADAEGCEQPGWRPLLRAAESGNVQAVELLLAHKADANLPDASGAPPLTRGLQHPQIVKLLLAAGADPNHKTKDGWPILLQAINNPTSEVLKLLLDFKADPNAATPNGWTALHLAIGQGDQEKVAVLLSYKTDVNARNNEGQTPLDVAKSIVKANPSPKSRSIEGLLEKHGALSDLPHFNSIRITRQGLEKPFVVFIKEAKLANQFTLLETVMSFYAKQSTFINNKMFTPLNELPFPDFERLIIRRPSAKTGGKEQVIKISLLNTSNMVDCAKDVPVEFGDVIEIPERVHALNETPADPFQYVKTGLSEAKSKSQFAETLATNLGSPTNSVATLHLKQAADLTKAIQQWTCLQKPVQLLVHGEIVSLTVDSWTEGFLNQALAKREARAVLRSSSDLSHVKVTRKDIKSGKLLLLLVDTADTKDRLWLQAGDVIEVSDKP